MDRKYIIENTLKIVGMKILKKYPVNNPLELLSLINCILNCIGIDKKNPSILILKYLIENDDECLNFCINSGK